MWKIFFDRVYKEKNGDTSVYLCKYGSRMRQHDQSGGKTIHYPAGAQQLYQQTGRGTGHKAVWPVGYTDEADFAGEKYLEHARTVMLQIGNMEREIRDITNHQTGRLRLGFPNERIIYMLPGSASCISWKISRGSN